MTARALSIAAIGRLTELGVARGLSVHHPHLAIRGQMTPHHLTMIRRTT
ncbi:hypothetical protein [Actinopolymorpha pittospori]|uniref:Uncharacterized protein n=1 Tax=Actinopolymorpha pittospori TaxID=648752 RepID=A0A927RML1_9ACTN|nr:hypothetical protein [Actinopolymorpha pittospori]MBE1610291.1 hypothetical protein [Actinopolymorpha pittospori]